MQIDEIVKIKNNCKHVNNSIRKKCWFQIKEFISDSKSKIEVFSHPRFVIKVNNTYGNPIKTSYKKNELKGTQYIINTKYLTGDDE